MDDKARLAAIKKFVSDKRREYLDVKQEFANSQHPGYQTMAFAAKELVKLCEDIEIILEGDEPQEVQS